MDDRHKIDNEIKIESWDQFESVAQSLGRAPAWSGTFAFRGQADSDWYLLSSLGRALTGHSRYATVDGEFSTPYSDIVDAAKIESLATQHFIARARNHASQLPESDDSWLEWWPIMQHYGVPTRLLDWTRSIYVAAYFAVRNFSSSSDAAIYFVHFEEVNRASIGSGDDLYDPDFVKKGAQQNYPPTVRFLTPRRMTNRMAAQQGMYSVCSSVELAHDEAINACLPDDAKQYFGRIIIPSSQKQWFVNTLHQMNVTAGALFPGMDGLGRETKEFISNQILIDILESQGLYADPLAADREGYSLHRLLAQLLDDNDKPGAK